MEARLDPKKFLRIHRSTIVNIKSVKELLPMFRGEYGFSPAKGEDPQASAR